MNTYTPVHEVHSWRILLSPVTGLPESDAGSCNFSPSRSMDAGRHRMDSGIGGHGDRLLSLRGGGL